MKIDKKIFAVQALALLGLIVSIKLCMIYYSVNYDKYAMPSFCSINDFVDCDGVARTRFSQFLGVPLSYWGVFLYIMILFLTFVNSIKDFLSKHNIKFDILNVFKNPVSYISTITAIGFICSMVLAGISFNIIHKICILCFVTYFIDLFIALIASSGFSTLFKDIKNTFVDFISGVKSYPKTFIAVLISVSAILTYTTQTMVFSPSVKATKSLVKYQKMKFNPYRVKGNILGVENADVVIELYSDFVCPLCYINNIMIHQAVSEYKNLKVIHYNYPFDKECNYSLQYNIHPGACFMSQGAIAAEKQGNYWEMSSLLYEKHPRNDEEMLKLADELGFNKEQFIKDLNSIETKNRIRTDIEKGESKKVDGTPTMIINGETIVGVKPYFTLQEILESHGAIRK